MLCKRLHQIKLRSLHKMSCAEVPVSVDFDGHAIAAYPDDTIKILENFYLQNFPMIHWYSSSLLLLKNHNIHSVSNTVCMYMKREPSAMEVVQKVLKLINNQFSAETSFVQLQKKADKGRHKR